MTNVHNILTAVLQNFLPFFLSTEAVRSSREHPIPRPRQTHVLRTNPNRGPMPTENIATTTAVSIRKKRGENHISAWLDRNDHMASDPIEVSDESDHENSRTSGGIHHKVERIAPGKPRRNLTKEKPPRNSSSVNDGPRLFGDKKRPDPEGVPIPVPGIHTNIVKSGPLRPMNTFDSNGPLTSKSISQSLSHGTQEGLRKNTSSLPAFKAPRKQISTQLRLPNEEGPVRKKPRLGTPSEGSMSKKSPIVIDDDVDMSHRDEQDELALSSDQDELFQARTQKHRATRSNMSANKTPISASVRVGEYHAVEDMMRPPKHRVPAVRYPLQILQSNDSQDEGPSSKDSGDEELFMKGSRQQRLEDEGGKLSPGVTVHRTQGHVAGLKAARASAHDLPEDIFYPSPAKPKNGEAESPDVLHSVAGRNVEDAQSTRVPLHQGSASNLADTISRGEDARTKSVGRSRQKTASGKANLAPNRDFPLRRLRYGSLPTDASYKATVQEASHKLVIYPQADSLLTDGEWVCAFPLSRILKIFHGKDGCAKVMLLMTRTQEDLDDKMHLELRSEKEMCDFIRLVQNQPGALPDVLFRESTWLDSAFNNYQQPQSTRKRPTQYSDSSSASLRRLEDSPPRKAARSHVKRTDQLQVRLPTSSSGVNGTTSPTRTVITGKERLNVAATDLTSSENVNLNPSARQSSPRGGGVLSKYFTSRATRSSVGNSIPLDGIDTELVKPEKTKFSLTGKLGTPWKKPLVYPKAGKKRETVDFQDLERLDDDEFLNDNLVGFYLRYLEHYLERKRPDVAKRVYFFNSYFFERLNQTQKGTKGINYAAVQKWTRTVDIFSRDFVVVPVNENLHWYVAIICNLPNLRRELADDEDSDEVESIATSETMPCTNGERSAKEQFQREEVEEPDGDTRSSFAGLSLGDEIKVASATPDPPVVVSDVKPQSPSKQKKGSGRRKSARRSLNKIDPNKPVVITLDSLGLSRTATRTTLKDYVVEEGKAKRSLDLDRGALDGVTAKGIPTQKNYSDCGLFLCAYMERFVLDPYKFIHDILQRDMDEGKDWPMMRSDELRSRLRNVIMELHRQQEGEAEMVPIPEVGKILLRGSPSPPAQPGLEPDLQEISSTKPDLVMDITDEEAASQVNDELTAAAGAPAQAMSSSPLSQGAALKSAEDAVNRPSPEKSNASSRRTPQAAIVIPDDSPNSPVRFRAPAKLKSPASIDDDFINGPDELADNPHALAEKMRRERGSRAPEGTERPASVSTDFMEGLQSYARDSPPKEVPGAWNDGEIPETCPEEENEGQGTAEVDDFPDDIIQGL